MNENQITLLVREWDEVHKKGQLSVWVLLAILEGKKHAGQINKFMEQATDGHFEVKEQSLYRALRRFTSMGLITISHQESTKRGPQLKYFELTPAGSQVLRRFVQLNITPLYGNRVQQLIQSLDKE